MRENERSLFQVKATSFLRAPGYRLSAHGNKLHNTDLLDFVNRMLICWGNFQAHPTPHRDRAPLILTQDCLSFPCAWTYNPRWFKTPHPSTSASSGKACSHIICGESRTKRPGKLPRTRRLVRVTFHHTNERGLETHPNPQCLLRRNQPSPVMPAQWEGAALTTSSLTIQKERPGSLLQS